MVLSVALLGEGLARRPEWKVKASPSSPSEQVLAPLRYASVGLWPSDYLLRQATQASLLRRCRANG